MHYITNENHQIIAADQSLLQLLHVENLAELYKKVALEEVSFSTSISEEEMTIRIDETTKNFSASTHVLSSLLGEMFLVELLEEVSKEETVEAIETMDSLNILPSMVEEDDLMDLTSFPEEESEIEITPELEPESKEDEVLFDLLDISEEEPLEELVIEEETVAVEHPLQEENEMLFDILPSSEEPQEEATQTQEEEEDALLNLDDETLVAKEPQNEILEVVEEEDLSPIVLDIEAISQSIGISHDDYNTFLNEYIDTALNFQEDLQSDQIEKRAKALSTLSHLSNVLHLNEISDTLVQIKSHALEEQTPHIERFYSVLSRITTVVPKEESLELEVPQEEIPAEELIEEKVEEVKKEGFGTIDLSDVKPIHFDFQIEKAANDLSLPVELIEEFVTDYIQQAHEETDKILKAYEEGDLKTIQDIGHLLKGAASNLRIEPLAETLYEIQFCEDPKQLEKLLPYYWAHFLSLENQMNIISQSK